MKCLLLCVMWVVGLMSCRNQSGSTIATNDSVMYKHVDTTALSNDSVKVITLQNGTHCFTYTNNQDTISMQLILNDTLASGSLVYNFYEKDKNRGTFKGSLTNDTLLANYTFLSEGIHSVRQIIFLLKGNILLPGSGSMKEQRNRLVFSNKKDIAFDDNLVLKPVDCKTLNFK